MGPPGPKGEPGEPGGGYMVGTKSNLDIHFHLDLVGFSPQVTGHRSRNCIEQGK